MKKLLLGLVLFTGCTTHTVVKTSWSRQSSLENEPTRAIHSETFIYGSPKQVLKAVKGMVKFFDDEYLYNRTDK